MSEIFEQELITLYETVFKELLDTARQSVTQEFLSELCAEKVAAAENLQRKHELLAKEYSK